MSFSKKHIDLKFQLGTGDFGSGGNDTVDLKGLRCSVDLNFTGGMQMASADIRVFGMPLDVMNKLTILNTINYTKGRYNFVTVMAGTDAKMAMAFTGGITEAWVDAKGQPDVAFHVAAHAGIVDLLRPIPPTSFKGSVDVVTVISAIAKQMNPVRTLETNGVSIQLADPYYPGTALAQIQAAVVASGIDYFDDGATIALYPKDGNRKSLGVVNVSVDDGMVGYPAFSQNSIDATILWNPAVQCGMQANVKSSLTAATGSFNIYQVQHSLDSEAPDGQWFTHLSMNALGTEAPIPTP